MSREEADCLNSNAQGKSPCKDNPTSTLEASKYVRNPILFTNYPPSQFPRSSIGPMATMSTNTMTVPSTSNIVRPISSPTRISTGHPGFSMVCTSDNPNQHGDEGFKIVRRKNRMLPNPKKEHSTQIRIYELRGKFLACYVSGEESKKRELCSLLIAENAPINTKYKELDLESLLQQNLVKNRHALLVQAIGIQEKYASNLIKPIRPQFWRTVKFTSSLWKTYLDDIHGSVDILKKMGYTKQVKDGLSFPDDISEPDVQRVKEIAADLYLAKIEIDDITNDRHPYLVIESTIKGVSSTPSEERVHLTISTSEDSDSEYEDAKDGLSTEDETASHQVPASTLKQQTSGTPAPDCFVCGNKNVFCFCNVCKQHFCQACDGTFHSRQDRKNHARRRFGSESPTNTSTPKSDEHKVVPPTLPIRRTYENTLIQKPVPTRLEDDGIKIKKQPPIPKPRKRIPSKTSRESGPSMTSGVSSPGNPPTARSSGMDNKSSVGEFSPPIFNRSVQNPIYMDRNMTKIGSVIKEKVPQQPSVQSIEREILRPPAVANYKPVNEPLKVLLQSKHEDHIYESLKSPEHHIYEALDLQSKDPPPPPLPPRSHEKETKATRVINKGATTCPHCYCLNLPDTSSCVACGTRLSEQSSSEGQIPRRHEEQRVIYDPSQTVYQRQIEKPQGTTLSTKTAENPLYVSNMPHFTSTTGMQDAKTKSTKPGSTDVIQGAEWECEYCTYRNPVDKNVCDMCAKTKSEGARLIKPTPPPPVESQSPKVVRRQSSQSDPSFAVQLQEDELKRNEEALRAESQSQRVYSLQKREEELLQTNADDHKGLDYVHQFATDFASPTSSYPSVFSSSSEGESQELFNKISKEKREPRREVSRDYKEIRESREAGQEFVRKMKQAEILGFMPEELNIAYTLSVDDPAGPIHWLQTKWFDLIHLVMIKFTDLSKEQDIGNLSPEEARQALVERTGDVEEAVRLSIEERKKGLEKVMASGFYPRTECLSALDQNDGDVDKSIQDLQVMSFQPMLQRIWDSCLTDNTDGNDEWHNPRNPDRQLSTSHDDEMFEAMVSNKELDKERRIRVIFAEKRLISWGRAETAIRLVDASFPVMDSVEAAKEVGDFDRAKQFLRRECILCADFKPESQMVTMLNCQCRFCRDCVNRYVTTVIHDQNIMKLVCPACDEPKNLDNDAVATEYFNNLDIMILCIVDEQTHDLFQQKLRDRTLMKEPNFRWCSHCSSGFINEQPNVIKMACPNCRKYTCFKCKKQWEDQHEGITCEQFAAWKEANDPEAQANGLAAHLKQNGIECPNCKFRYDLAKGGCMHFKCNQCSHEFCSGCYQPFRQGNHCPVAGSSCAKRGLHAHHPRDCLFFLRDRDPEELKKLLDEHNIPYNTEPPQRPGAGAVNQGYQEGEAEEVQGAAAAAADVGRCKVMEQRETTNGLQDAECGRETPAGYAGLCRLHFTEYLVEKLNANLIDPLGMYNIQDLEILIRRNDQEPPARKSREKDAPFRERLIQFVQTQLPLPKLPPRGRVLNIDEPVAEDHIHLILNEERDGPFDGALINDGFDGAEVVDIDDLSFDGHEDDSFIGDDDDYLSE